MSCKAVDGNFSEVGERRRDGEAVPESCSIPARLRAFNIPQAKVMRRLQRANGKPAARAQLGEAEYMVRGERFICKSLRLSARSALDYRFLEFPCVSPMWPVFQIGPECAAASPSWTARAKSRAAYRHAFREERARKTIDRK